MAGSKENIWHLYQLWIGLGVVLLILIAILSLIPVPDGPAGNDKLAHVIMYAIPSSWFSLIVMRRTSLVWIFVALMSYGLLMEFLQGLTDYRSAEFGDAMANGLGAIIGLMSHFSPLRRWLIIIDHRLSRL